MSQGSSVSFGGFFEVTVTSTQTAPVALDGVKINSALAIGGVSTLLNAAFSDTSLDSLALSTNGAIGPLAVGTAVAVDPSTLSFLSWQSNASFSLFELDVSDVLYVTTPQTESYNQFSVSGSVNETIFRVSTKLGICPLCFWEASLCVDWIWADCGPEMEACLQVTDAVGFSSFDLTASELVLFEDFHGISGELDLAVSFTIEEKSVSPTVSIQSDWPICPEIDFLGEISTGAEATEIDALLLYGIRGEVAVSRETTFRVAESFAEEKDGTVTGKADYFQRFGVTGSFPSCCGSIASIEIDVYFERAPAPSGGLFAVGLMTVSLDVPFTSAFAVSADVDYPLDGSGWKVTSRLRVIW